MKSIQNQFEIDSKSIRNRFENIDTIETVDLNQTIDTSQNENIDTIDTTTWIKPLTPAKTIDSKRIRNRFEIQFEIYSKYDSKTSTPETVNLNQTIDTIEQ